MFGRALNTPLIFKLLRGKLRRSLLHVTINCSSLILPEEVASFVTFIDLCQSFFFFPFLFSWISELMCSSIIYIATSNSFSAALSLTRWSMSLNKGGAW